MKGNYLKFTINLHGLNPPWVLGDLGLLGLRLSNLVFTWKSTNHFFRRTNKQEILISIWTKKKWLHDSPYRGPPPPYHGPKHQDVRIQLFVLRT